MSLSIILTCFNEVPLIFETYEKIVSMMKLTNIDCEFLVVDDGSTPENKKDLDKYFLYKEKTQLIMLDVNEGRGAAVTKGIKASTKEYACFIDTDLEIPANEIFNLYFTITSDSASVDIVIGKRVYLLGANLYEYFRAMNSKIYTFLVNLLFRLNSLDTESGIKIFKTKKILPILDFVKDKRWFWDTEVVLQSIENNLKITQKPVFVIRKLDKKSSVHFFRDTCRYLTSIYQYSKRRKNRKATNTLKADGLGVAQK